MNIDLYKILGIDRGASKAEIRKAYRQTAKSTHPDHGGSSEKFQKVKLALNILTDPERKKKYDNTGEIDEEAPDNTEAGALGIIVGIFHQAAEEAIKNNLDLMSNDMVKVIGVNIGQRIKALQDQRTKLNKMAEIIRKFEDRLKAKSGKTLLKQMLLAHAATISQKAASMEAEIKSHELASQLLKDYNFETLHTLTQGYGLYSAAGSSWVY